MKQGARSGLGAAAIGGAVFLLAFAVRASNARVAFVGGSPQISPVDELYHAKRIVYSAQNPLRVLDFDPARGTRGAFCAWPPLYDLSSGTAARILGGRAPAEILRRAAWFPPILAALAVGILAAAAAQRLGWTAGVLVGTAVALAAPWVDKSRVSSIDHHFLEPALAFGVLGAIFLVRRAQPRRLLEPGAALGVAISAALMVQPALLLAAGFAAAAVLLLEAEHIPARAAACIGFAFAAAVVLVYRATLPAGRPDNEWFLGVPHAAALLGAAAACGADGWFLSRGVRRIPAAFLAVVLGALTVAAVPTAVPAMLSGSRFLGGDPWLAQVTEFGPLFFRPGSVFALDVALLGTGGILLVAALLLDRRWRSGFRAIVASYALAYALSAASTYRLIVVAAPLLAFGGALVSVDLLRSRAPRARVAAAIALLLLPSAFLCAGRVLRPSPVVPARAAPILRAAAVLRENPNAGRVLPPWSWGHVFDVLGVRSVLVDNFGTFIGRTEFENALGILLSPREEAVAQFCERTGTRFIVLENPYPNLGFCALAAGFPFASYPPDSPPTKLMRASFWWRAYFAPGASPRIGRFRRVDVTPEPETTPPELRAVQIWELAGPPG